MYLTARLAPCAPMRRAMIGGLIGTVLATAGAGATVPMDLGPAWYPIALAVTALPLFWLGGALYRRPPPDEVARRVDARSGQSHDLVEARAHLIEEFA